MRICKRMNGVDKVLWGGTVVFVMMAVVCGAVLSMVRASADDSTTALVTVSSSCQMNATTDSAHTAEVTASTYQADIGKTTFTATCNDANGYAVYAVGYTNTEYGRNDMLGLTTGLTIDTGLATSGGTSAWAMKLTPVEADVAPTITTGYDAYHVVPDEYTKVASYANSTMRNQSGSQFEATYAVYASNVQAPDTYSGKVKYTLLHPSTLEDGPCMSTYQINYNANGGSGHMDSQTACVDRGISLLPSGFTPPTPVEDFKFAQWNTAADGSGYTYTARQAVTNIASSGGAITLYAQWTPKYMQDLTAAQCQAYATDAPLTVVDKRDGSDYTIRWLQGACWMTQNLRITGVVYDTYSNFSTYDHVNVCEADLTVGNDYDQPRCHDSGNTSNGVWYNYAAVSAKTIVSSNNSVTATEDICPSGWKLFSRNGDYGSINSLAGKPVTIVEAFSPVSGGYYAGGSLTDTGRGFWWADDIPSTYGSSRRHILVYGSNSLSMYSDSGKWAGLIRGYGNNIRCIKKDE